MMDHEGTDGDAFFVRWQPLRCIIHRFIKAEFSAASIAGQPLQIFTCLNRRNHQRQRRGVGSNHQVLSQSSFQAQPGNAKGAVLVVQLSVSPVVTGLRNPPRHAASVSISDLLLHRRPASMIQQGVLKIGHDQQRHQVFEHRAAPGNQDWLIPRSDQQAAHGEPMVLRNLPQRDGDVTAQSRLRGQQIVEAGIVAPFGDVETGGEQIPRRVE